MQDIWQSAICICRLSVFTPYMLPYVTGRSGRYIILQTDSTLGRVYCTVVYPLDHVSKMNVVARAQLTFQMLALLQ